LTIYVFGEGEKMTERKKIEREKNKERKSQRRREKNKERKSQRRREKERKRKCYCK
jgi:hypothetical protein